MYITRTAGNGAGEAMYASPNLLVTGLVMLGTSANQLQLSIPSAPEINQQADQLGAVRPGQIVAINRVCLVICTLRLEFEVPFGNTPQRNSLLRTLNGKYLAN